MRVYLVQHGESKSEEEDPQRRLTGEGVRNVQKVAQFLRPLGLKLAAIWHSDKDRARQTAEILAGAVGGGSHDRWSPSIPWPTLLFERASCGNDNLSQVD
jgi:phosphohistidine phosphatase SixA